MTQNRWEEFAQEDAEFYILTSVDEEQGGDRRARFYASGKPAASRLLALARPHLESNSRAVEIGCGMGRLSFPMAEHFDELVAVDIAPTMLRKLRHNAKEMGVFNVVTHLADGDWDADESVDLAYSWLVFQHIGDWSIISSYIERIATALRPGGVACLQFDTRPRTIAYRLRDSTPTFLLPRTWREGIRRIRRAPELLRAEFVRHGMEVLDESGGPGVEHVFILRRRSQSG